MVQVKSRRTSRIHTLPLVVLSAATVLLSSCASTPTDNASPSDAKPSVVQSDITGGSTADGTSGIADSCPAVDPPDTGTAAGWLGYLAAHRSDVGLVVDDGRGTRVEYRPAEAAPAASAAKVLHLAAYARAVDAGVLDPNEPVRVADWEAWYLPGLDGGAHPQALQALGVPNDGVRSSDPNSTVRWDDLVTAMIKFSDNAAPDLLRERLGDDTPLEVAAETGWPGTELPSYLGSQILLLKPELTSEVSSTERSATELGLAKRYAGDPAFRADVQATAAPDLTTQFRWAENTTTTTPAALEALHRTLSETASTTALPGSIRAREQLEWNPAPDGTLGLGAKGGALPGVITEGMTIRRTDGTTASAVLMVRRMPEPEWTIALQSFAHQELPAAALQDPSVLNRLSCAVDQGSTIPR